MKELHILTICLNPRLGCWSSAHRCFIGRFERIMFLATRVLGSRMLAEQWVHKPAIGLRRQLPCNMLATRSGYEQVSTHLERIEQGIYV